MNCTKYTPEQIAEALEVCNSEQSCPDCPVVDDKPTCGRLERIGAEVIRELSKQVKELEAASRWISVSERLPNTGGREEIEVLVMIKGTKEATTLYVNDEGEFYAPDDTGGTFYPVTHWRPMPAGITPPAGRGGERE